MTLGTFFLIGSVAFFACILLLQTPITLVVSTSLAVSAFATVSATVVFALSYFSAGR